MIINHSCILSCFFPLFFSFFFNPHLRLIFFTNRAVGVHLALTGVAVNPLGVFKYTAPLGSEGDCMVDFSAALFFGGSDSRGFVFLTQVMKGIRPFFEYMFYCKKEVFDREYKKI